MKGLAIGSMVLVCGLASQARPAKAFLSSGYMDNDKTSITRRQDLARFQRVFDIDKAGVGDIANPRVSNELFAIKYLNQALRR